MGRLNAILLPPQLSPCDITCSGLEAAGEKRQPLISSRTGREERISHEHETGLASSIHAEAGWPVRQARQPRRATDRSTPFFERLLGDEQTRLSLVQRPQHAQPVTLRLGNSCFRCHPRLVSH